MQGVAATREVWEGGARQRQKATREGVRQQSEGWDNTEQGWGKDMIQEESEQREKVEQRMGLQAGAGSRVWEKVS